MRPPEQHAQCLAVGEFEDLTAQNDHPDKAAQDPDDSTRCQFSAGRHHQNGEQWRGRVQDI
jgi:hypothetical protein